MNNFLKNVLLIVIAIFISYFTSEHFGRLYNSIFGSGGAWIGSESSWNLIIGFPLSLIFFITLIFYTWGSKSINRTLLLISPVILWEAIVDIRHIYISIILTLVAFGLATLLRKALPKTTY